MKYSAGILLYRMKEKQAEFLLVHPGGPFWAKKDEGAWSVPKGEYTNKEDPLNAAIREFKEETGADVNGPFIELTPLKQKSGKLIRAWACSGDFDVNNLQSNFFSMEWPPRSGIFKEYPEVDKAGWFVMEEALKKLIPGQHGFLRELSGWLKQ